jgi:hypothetical protein
MRITVVMAVALAACGGGGDDSVTLAITSPAPGAAFTRDQLDDETGSLAALVAVAVEVDGSPKRIGLDVNSLPTWDLDIDTLTGEAWIFGGGPLVLTATASDSAGTVLATASVDITVAEATPATCADELALYKVAFTAGPANEGVADPVTADVPINGVSYRVLDAANPRTKMFGDCTLIRSLARAAPILRGHGIVEVSDLGIYNYRCIGGGTPPNCPQGISQHAYATAIDIAAFEDDAGERSVVNDDWVIDPDSEDTCAAPTEPGKDQFLHTVICDLKNANTWNIVLTPNYNADHRNHFHVDLTPDADFIE